LKKLLSVFSLLSLIFVTACSSGGASSNEKSSEANFPTGNIELVAPASPGGGWDATARAMQKILKEEEIIDQNINVVNKPGGGGEVGWQYTSKKDAHSLTVNSSLLITNHLLGQSDLTYEDFTPLATLATEWISVAVPNDSAFKTASEIMERLKEDPSSVKIGLAPGLGNNDHLSFVQAAKEYGVDVTKLNFLVYESGGDVVTSLLGGHVDIATMAVSESKEQHQAGKFKVLAVTSDDRLEGLEDVPTWQEEGVDMVFPHWRGVMGPPNMTDEEIAFWNEKISEMVQTEAWQQLLQNNDWEDFYQNSEDTVQFFKEQNEMYDELVNDSGLTN
jgi:tripartite-type tricarboxylate transporter receptor subunit TctC